MAKQETQSRQTGMIDRAMRTGRSVLLAATLMAPNAADKIGNLAARFTPATQGIEQLTEGSATNIVRPEKVEAQIQLDPISIQQAVADGQISQALVDAGRVEITEGGMALHVKEGAEFAYNATGRYVGESYDDTTTKEVDVVDNSINIPAKGLTLRLVHDREDVFGYASNELYPKVLKAEQDAQAQGKQIGFTVNRITCNVADKSACVPPPPPVLTPTPEPTRPVIVVPTRPVIVVPTPAKVPFTGGIPED